MKTKVKKSKPKKLTVLTLDGTVSIQELDSKGKVLKSQELDGEVVLGSLLYCIKLAIDLVEKGNL